MGWLDALPSQHLLRHITRIQIKNLTPFPARDSLTSALSQPSEQSQFTPFGSLSDDLDVALARKRARKVSTTSVGAKEAHGGIENGGVDLRGRKRTTSRGSTFDVSTSPPSAARTFRPRATSMASTSSIQTWGTSALSVGVWPDRSQSTLERILRSRLVETFITVTVPPRPSTDIMRPNTPQSASFLRTFSPLASPTIPSSAPPHRDRFASTRHKPSSSSAGSRSKLSERGSVSLTKVAAIQEDLPSGSQTSARPSRAGSLHVVQLESTTLASSSSSSLDHKARHSSASFSSQDSERLSVPDYISLVHHPSTNPSFHVNFRARSELPEWTNRSAQKFTVHLWAKVLPGIEPGGKDKGKAKATVEECNEAQWKVMDEWTVDLSEVVPLPTEYSDRPSLLPHNTLLLSLWPSEQAYYVPTPPSSAATRPPSPSAGYSSDPESRNPGPSTAELPLNDEGSLPTVDREPRELVTSDDSSRISRLRGEETNSAGWQDLLKLVTLQSVLVDTQSSLMEVITSMDSLISADEVAPLKREISAREARVKEVEAYHSAVREDADQQLCRIRARREALRQRREALRQATSFLEEDSVAVVNADEELARERSRNAALRNRLNPVRVALISTLAYIFPIELLSGPDLLYTMLDVPLPIPLGTTDPAPPLTLASHKEVNEDAIATALAYAALVVQLLAVYLGKGLVYPITFIGSRSLIRDGISAMVGPRMFPLFSKGVDTYRFEYGVFLLNKDIEMLMSERDLRALDMRHTLPNLKNLLLTLTDGEDAGVSVPPIRSPVSSVSGLQSPRSSSPVESTTDGLSSAHGGTDSPPRSGSTTPSAKSSRISMPFFGLSGFLRSRYPSSSQQPSVKAVPEIPEASIDASAPSSSADTQDDEEDRRTLRNEPITDGREEGKLVGNGHAVHSPLTEDEEKLLNGDGGVPLSSPPVLAHT
ncbi:hypothetical protein OF83DRAFT_1168837 [Amylostereum chailletii]|nr:hypothetical protein OF83DRAFT_1168837 [Amylostereum chailletii]